jgi:hypothetical protein
VEKERYNDQMMIQYLLGSLPEEETERFDELSFIDDEFAVRLSAVENDLVDTYVRGKLSAEKLEKFDSYYLASPKRREKVKTAQAFHTFAENAVATGQVIFAPVPSEMNVVSGKPFAQPALLRGFFTFPRLVLTAAAIVGLVVVGWLVVELSRLRSQVDEAQARRLTLEQRERELQDLLEQQRSSSSATEKELERVRQEKDRLERQMALEGEIAKSQSPRLPANPNIFPFKLAAPNRTVGQVPTLTIPSEIDYVALQVELEPDDYPSYNAVLLTQPGRKPAGWKRERLKSKAFGENKVIEVMIPGTLLKSQAYLLAVTGVSDRGVAEGERGYPFRVVKQ